MGFLDIFNIQSLKSEIESHKQREQNHKIQIENLQKDLTYYKEDIVPHLKSELADYKETIEKYKEKESRIVPQASQKQNEIFYKNLKEAKDGYASIQKYLKRYNLNHTTEEYYYRVELERLLTGAKCKDMLFKFHENNINYVDEIDENLDAYKTIKNSDIVIKKIDDFKNNNLNWDLITYINRGDKVTKIFPKSRKLVNILSDENIEFMEDLRDFDFSKLLIMRFKPTEIKEFEEIAENYYKEKRMSVK